MMTLLGLYLGLFLNIVGSTYVLLRSIWLVNQMGSCTPHITRLIFILLAGGAFFTLITFKIFTVGQVFLLLGWSCFLYQTKNTCDGRLTGEWPIHRGVLK